MVTPEPVVRVNRGVNGANGAMPGRAAIPPEYPGDAEPLATADEARPPVGVDTGADPATARPVAKPPPVSRTTTATRPATSGAPMWGRPAERSTTVAGSGSAVTRAARSAKWERRRSSSGSVMVRSPFGGRRGPG